MRPGARMVFRGEASGKIGSLGEREMVGRVCVCVCKHLCKTNRLVTA